MIALLAFLAPFAPVQPPSPRYLRDVRPILIANCLRCHGQDDGHRMADLRLDIPNRAAIPGDAVNSALARRILTTDSSRMPPNETGHTLTAAQKSTLLRWIDSGATYQKHWSFTVPLVPVRQISIDALISARLSKDGLRFSPEADRCMLARRVSLDLTGLPPTREESGAFAGDPSPGAYENLVDRLLASPRFGEKWARPWLDLGRFADSAGYGSDPLRPNLWPWRDYLIRSLNGNKPYDVFGTELLAGDLSPNPSVEQLTATAFHRNTMTNTEGGTDREEFRTAAVKDRAIVTMQAFTGLTVQCAQCHTHKYDPITQRDFYRLMAIFNQTEDNDQPDERPTMLVGAVNLPVMRELEGGKRRISHVLTLGNFLLPGEVVTPGVPAAFANGASVTNRLELARWLFSKNNPFTARAAVNRIWAQLFGIGLVETEEDFGTMGALPSHPELLDALAVDFQKDWNVKRLIKTILISRTYRQSSKTTPELLAKDPKARLLSRYPRRRLDAEGVRDSALALSGLLSPKIGGPSVFPPQPDGLWKAAFNGDRTYPTSVGEDRFRRGLYTFWRRTVPYPALQTFDAPSRESCLLRRMPTNTPLQALVTLNDPAYLEMAMALGRRIVASPGKTVADKSRWGLRLVLGHPPTESQVETVAALWADRWENLRTRPEDAKKLAECAALPLPKNGETAELAAWTLVGNVLLNLDAVLSRS